MPTDSANSKKPERAHEILQAVFDRVNDGKEKPEDLLGKNIWEVYPEGIGQPFYLAYYKAMATIQ